MNALNNNKEIAAKILKEFKGDNYLFGINCIDELGSLTLSMGKKVSVIVIDPDKGWSKPVYENIVQILSKAGIELAGNIIRGARPNAPQEDVYRIAGEIEQQNPEVVVTIGAGSSIDASKAAVAYLTLKEDYPDLNDYFGMGIVSQMLQKSGQKMLPVIAVQLTSGSAAHLTKYSNITDFSIGQKMLIIDEAVIPPKALFDYSFSCSQPKDLTMDGGLDGIAHCLEVYMGIPEEHLDKAKLVCLTGIEIIVQNLIQAVENPNDLNAREAIGLGTDLGGYAIMIGGTNGAHLNSFSLTDILSHGRACALMNPYYVVFFSPAIENRLRDVGNIFKAAGYITEDLDLLSGRTLGIAVANGMLNLSRAIGFPTTLKEVKGFTDNHISKCLEAAKNPKLESKLKNMPVPLSADMIDEYMGAVLQAAKTGDLDLVKNLS